VALLGDAAPASTLITGQGMSTAVVGVYVLAGELAAAEGDYRRAFTRYKQECRSYVEQSQEIALKNREMDLPQTWEEIDKQIEFLRAMEAAPQGSLPEDSLPDLIQKAANATHSKTTNTCTYSLPAFLKAAFVSPC
jgi:2-polyprenyl-6-methoxyphenol hydroxylase-like FAD-dependent oxidoreductase